MPCAPVGAIWPELSGQGQRPALGLSHVAGPYSLGRTLLGLAVPALPFLTVLAPSERYFRQRGRTPKAHRPGPSPGPSDGSATPSLDAPPSLGAAGGQRGYAVLDLPHFRQSLPQPVTFITRLRLEAGLYEPAPARLLGQNGRTSPGQGPAFAHTEGTH